jgi:AbrB family looped-hinge helix DNA binding protein
VPTTVTSKGQVTVPKAVREALGISAGTKLVWEMAEDGRVWVAKASGRAAGRSVPLRDRFARARGTATGGMTTEEIMALMRGED